MDSAEQLLKITDALLKTAPDNFTARADRYRAFSLLGGAYETRGRKPGSATELQQSASIVTFRFKWTSVGEILSPDSSPMSSEFGRFEQLLDNLFSIER